MTGEYVVSAPHPDAEADAPIFDAEAPARVTGPDGAVSDPRDVPPERAEQPAGPARAPA